MKGRYIEDYPGDMVVRSSVWILSRYIIYTYKIVNK